MTRGATGLVLLLALVWLLVGCHPPHGLPGADGKITDPLADGRVIYTAACASCHLENGAGLVGIHPPLAGSSFVKGPVEPLAALMLWGLRGPVKVEGVTYNGLMPMWKDVMNDQQIAAVLTYIRHEWDNGANPVGPHEITRMRNSRQMQNSFLTPEELASIQQAAIPSN